MRASFTLGKIWGIPIRINYTWFLIFIVVTVSLSLDFATVSPRSSPATYWLLGALSSLLFFGSVLAHEAAHSLVARAQGIPVRDITLFIFGGVSSIEEEGDLPHQELLMAGVGPATSMALAMLFALLAWLLNPIHSLGGIFLGRLAYLNLGLALFNLLPGLPLDGGRILRSIVWLITQNYRRATRIATLAGRGLSFLLIGGGIVLAFLSPENWTSGVWLALIGWFMDNAATQSYQQMVLQEVLRGVTVAELLSTDCTRIPRGLSVTELVDGYVLRQGTRCFAVTDGERLSGLVTMHNIRDLPRERWPYTPVGEVMIPHHELALAYPHEDAWTVLKRMEQRNVNQLPVEEGERFLGMFTRENLLRYVRTRAELGI